MLLRESIWCSVIIKRRIPLTPPSHLYKITKTGYNERE